MLIFALHRRTTRVYISAIIYYAVVEHPGALPGLAVGYEQQPASKGFVQEVKDEYQYCKSTIGKNLRKLNRKRRRVNILFPGMIDRIVRTTKTSSVSGPNLGHFCQNLYRNVTRRDVADTLLPCLLWMRTYNLIRDLPRDIISGLSVGLMVVPQGLAYAGLVGVPTEYGLYAGVNRNMLCRKVLFGFLYHRLSYQ
jgi:hypothetical protein